MCGICINTFEYITIIFIIKNSKMILYVANNALEIFNFLSYKHHVLVNFP